MPKFSGILFGVICFAGFAAPAIADEGWTGPGWYEVVLLGIVIGPLDTYEECEQYARPNAQAHPDYGYDCVYLGKDPG
jgi:hypothetical protein